MSSAKLRWDWRRRPKQALWESMRYLVVSQVWLRCSVQEHCSPQVNTVCTNTFKVFQYFLTIQAFIACFVIACMISLMDRGTPTILLDEARQIGIRERNDRSTCWLCSPDLLVCRFVCGLLTDYLAVSSHVGSRSRSVSCLWISKAFSQGQKQKDQAPSEPGGVCSCLTRDNVRQTVWGFETRSSLTIFDRWGSGWSSGELHVVWPFQALWFRYLGPVFDTEWSRLASTTRNNPTMIILNKFLVMVYSDILYSVQDCKDQALQIWCKCSNFDSTSMHFIVNSNSPPSCFNLIHSMVVRLDWQIFLVFWKLPNPGFNAENHHCLKRRQRAIPASLWYLS